MKDAIKTLYEHWINVHTTTPAEKSAFEVINEAAKVKQNMIRCTQPLWIIQK